MPNAADTSIPDAARLLGLSYNQTMRLYFIGRLDGERRGGRVFVTQASVDRERAVTVAESGSAATTA